MVFLPGPYECIPRMAGNFEAGYLVLDDDENVSNAGDLASLEPPSLAAEEQALMPMCVE